LFGITGGGAIIGSGEGAQRFVGLGRPAAPGLTLKAVQQHAVILSGPSGDIRLGFGGAMVPVGGTAAPAQAASAPTSQAADAATREASLRYRLALAPRREGGQVVGYTVRPDVRIPALEQAGLRPGDTILSVNGSRLNEERMGELAWEVANASSTEFEVERGGRRMRLTLSGTRR
jgi:general secretion pathway protein C